MASFLVEVTFHGDADDAAVLIAADDTDAAEAAAIAWFGGATEWATTVREATPEDEGRFIRI